MVVFHPPPPCPKLTEDSGIEQHTVLKLPELKMVIKSESISIPWSLCANSYNRFLQHHSKSAMFIESLTSFKYIICSIIDFWQCHGFNTKFKASVDFFPCRFSLFSNKRSPPLSGRHERDTTSLQTLLSLGLHQPKAVTKRKCAWLRSQVRPESLKKRVWSGNWSQVSCRALTTKLSSMMGYLKK